MCGPGICGTIKRLRIGINLTPLRPGRIGGSETYVRGLVEQLARTSSPYEFLLFLREDTLAVENPPNHFQQICNAKAQATEPNSSTAARWRRAACRLGGRTVNVHSIADNWQRSLVDRYELDVWFDPLTTLTPRDLGCASVMTIVDIQHETYPQFFDRAEIARRAREYQPAGAAATRVIVISDYVRKTVLETYGLPGAKVSTVHLAAPSKSVAGGTDDAAVLRAHGVAEKFILYPANTWPHKNHARLIEAFRSARCGELDGVQLVLPGGEQWGESEVRAAAHELIKSGSVLRLGHIPTEHLPVLYRHARFLVFPSLYEGFGIPLVEAMQVGCPVVASGCGSIPEVAGDAALYVDAESPASIAEGMVRMHRDECLRDEMRRRGFDRAGRFSYERCAAETLRVLEEAYSSYRRKPRWREPAGCVGRHNIVYDRAFLPFRCPDARRLQVELSPTASADECISLELPLDSRGEAHRSATLGRTAIKIRCRGTDDGLVRLDFRVQNRPLLARLNRLADSPVCRIHRLSAVCRDGSVFDVISPDWNHG